MLAYAYVSLNRLLRKKRKMGVKIKKDQCRVLNRKGEIITLLSDTKKGRLSRRPFEWLS